MRDFEKTFNKSVISLPIYENKQIAFDFMESFIKSIEKECIRDVVCYQEAKKRAYERVVGFKSPLKC
ncbi:MAG: hypothetical protein MR629_02120 [Helicobacter sp.]|nr:hypothetical protein [Helicobacter sp.]